MSSVIISGDTSGAITLAAPAVSGTNTATLPAATGTVMVSGNMPAFSAYLNASQNVTASTFTKVQLNTEVFDTANCFDSTTNYRFTPTVAGYYQFNAFLECASGATRFLLSFYKNGSEFYRGTDFPVTTQQVITSSCIMYLNGSTDYVELYTYITGITTQLKYNSSAETSMMQGCLLRTA